jgi:hypothetical protein
MPENNTLNALKPDCNYCRMHSDLRGYFGLSRPNKEIMDSPKPPPRQVNSVLLLIAIVATLLIGRFVVQCRREKEKPVDVNAVHEEWRTNAHTNTLTH